ncbi:hypothetical protein BU16DRAFT_583558 [Lophium mytilinum]|uniref:DNA replication checkpoint mediator MRC1 domain-containing protein n=1 Tax=Lophium mytilinum TaxID=390894 RepID=A0A6A6QMG7_9PEZI|nr:hypothetical protein BU16DRAFT_583558 [Lophium mytilinum]
MSSPASPTRSSRATSIQIPSQNAEISSIEHSPKPSQNRSSPVIPEDYDENDASVTSSTSSTPSKNAEGQRESLVNSVSEEEDEDTPVRQPRGKLAARLLGQNFGSGLASKSALDASEHGKGRTQPRKDFSDSDSTSSKAASQDEEESPVKMSSRRNLLKRKAASPSPRRSQTPVTQSRASSPGLFVSPSRDSPIRAKGTARVATGESDSDSLPNATQNSRLRELVAKKRAERKAQEEESRKRDQEKIKRLEKVSARSRKNITADSESDADGETGRRLTQQARPTRKASKKALEELHRETQRMERNMQLAHQAKTKKKFNMQDLVSRLNPVQENTITQSSAQDTFETSLSSVAASSDVEGPHGHETPPTSPPSQDEYAQKDVFMTIDPTTTADRDSDQDLPDLKDILSQPKSVDKGKGRAADSLHIPLNPLAAQTKRPIIARNVRVVLPKQFTSQDVDLDSDEDLEITKPKSRFPVFDRIPKQQHKDSRALITQRVLANLTSPGKQGPKGRISMNPSGLQAKLQQLARQQALKGRDERLAELKAQGKIFQTEEEIEREQLQLDSMLDKAREMDAKLAKKEKADAKKDGKGDDVLDSDDEDDEDWAGSGKEEIGDEDIEDQAEDDLELSGSEDEEMAVDDEGEEGDDDVDDGETGKDAEVADMFDREAGEDNEPEQEEVDADGEASDEDAVPVPQPQRMKKRSRKVIIEDDEESDLDSQEKAVPSQSTPDDGMAAFGFNMDNTTSLGLTQMFAGTMANLQSQPQPSQSLDQDTQEDSLAFFRSLPITQPSFDEAMPDAPPDLLVPNSQATGDSQTGASPNKLQTASQGQPCDTQFSEVPEPTQDVGFELSRLPAGLIAPASTIDTVIMPVPESPILKRRGKLHRRAAATTALSDVDEDLTMLSADLDGSDSLDRSGNAFEVLKKGAKKSAAIQDFDWKTSEAKKMFEEQAEESEDEYAGLGGQSDDESGGEQDEEVAKMIDESEVNVDERKIAAFFAEKSRADDEKALDKLYKDVHNGGLRRKRGNDFDLSDAEDEEEERRRRRQLEYKKMKQALYADEKVGAIAQNPKKAAFLRALEDFDDDADNDYLLDGPDFDIEIDASQSEAISVPDSQQAEGANDAAAPPNPLKRKHAPTDSLEKENRPPPNLRRTGAVDDARKPTSLADIRESVSFLIDEPHSIPESQFSASESEDEEDTTRDTRTSRPIIDRLTLSRSNSAAEATSGAMAFHAPTTGSHPGFRVPSLIRRATSNLSAKGSTLSSTTSSGASTPVEAPQGVRRGGSGKSNIHYQAREAERRTALEKSDKRRRESIRKKAVKGRRGLSALAGLDSGFE